MNQAKASVILERAMLRLATAGKEARDAETKALMAQAIVANLEENLLSLYWNPTHKVMEIVTVKYPRYIH